MRFSRRQFLTLTVASAAVTALNVPVVADTVDSIDKIDDMPMRKLGKTGDKLSILCFGGFHLCEAMPADAEHMLNYYLDQGGNFIETAVSYGNGDSERKIGRVMKTRRNDCFLSSKTHFRTKDEAATSIDTSLTNLQTDHLDNLFVHCLTTQSELDTVLGPNGAMEAILKAKEAGKVRNISVSAHNPEILLKALQSYPFDAMLEWMNYFDHFNFPLISNKIIPYCLSKGIGMIAMKPVADGLLYRNPRNAFRWVWTLPITSIAAGNNNMAMLKTNIKHAKSFEPMDDDEKRVLYRTSPEYMNYVCRQCDECLKNDLDLDIKAIFEMEGYYDRQMYTGNVPDPAEYALRERLRFWFNNQAMAQERYSKLEKKVPKEFSNQAIPGKCPFNIDVPRKLRIAAWKLTGDEDFIRRV
ncbi:MAG: aldo/keto reductase [Armatimonadota bacterium]